MAKVFLMVALMGMSFVSTIYAETDISRIRRLIDQTPEESPIRKRLQQRLLAIAARDQIQDPDCSILLALQEPGGPDEVLIESGAVIWIFDVTEPLLLQSRLNFLEMMDRGRVSEGDKYKIRKSSLEAVTEILQQPQFNGGTLSSSALRVMADVVYRSSRDMMNGIDNPKSRPLIQLQEILTSWNPRIGLRLQIELLTALLSGAGRQGYQSYPEYFVTVAAQLIRWRSTLPLAWQYGLYSAILQAELTYAASTGHAIAEFLKTNGLFD